MYEFVDTFVMHMNDVFSAIVYLINDEHLYPTLLCITFVKQAVAQAIP
jgi:hypothetical protein